MGCYAAFNAIKAADAICASDENAKVLVLCLELCTIHFQKSTEEDHLLSGALFSDGAAALWMSNQAPDEGPYLEAKRFYCDLFLDGKQEMAWHIGDHGFEMRLTSYVPALIQKGITELTHKLLEGHHINRHEIEHYAIHPGGKRILEVIEKELELTKEDNAAAYEVLSKYGNMSSPTVLFVLKNILDRLKKENNGQHILSFAFGPGLTLESMLLEIHYE
jgi:alpha-pyrone synthase